MDETESQMVRLLKSGLNDLRVILATSLVSILLIFLNDQALHSTPLGIAAFVVYILSSAHILMKPIQFLIPKSTYANLMVCLIFQFFLIGGIEGFFVVFYVLTEIIMLATLLFNTVIATVLNLHVSSTERKYCPECRGGIETTGKDGVKTSTTSVALYVFIGTLYPFAFYFLLQFADGLTHAYLGRLTSPINRLLTMLSKATKLLVIHQSKR
jgi:hypothetical protein